MALERSVLMGDGVVRRHHVITHIQHILNTATIIEVVSYPYDNSEESTGCHTSLTHAFDDGISFSDAYEWIAIQPEFEEHASDMDQELIEMNARITELNGEVAQAQKDISDLNDSLVQSSEKLTTVLVVLTDEQALNFPTYFPEWKTDTDYAVDTRVYYLDSLYRCVQAHASQDNWTPDATPALWTKVALPGVIEEWRQPTGAQDAYQTGDKVTHNGQTWVSTADNNVWEPGVYGWEVSE